MTSCMPAFSFQFYFITGYRCIQVPTHPNCEHVVLCEFILLDLRPRSRRNGRYGLKDPTALFYLWLALFLGKNEKKGIKSKVVVPEKEQGRCDSVIRTTISLVFSQLPFLSSLLFCESLFLILVIPLTSILILLLIAFY